MTNKQIVSTPKIVIKYLLNDKTKYCKQIST